MGRKGIDAWQRYLDIQAFKRDPGSTIDGVNYAHVVAQYLYDRSPRQWLKSIAFSLFFAAQTDLTGTQQSLLNFYSHRYKRRPDYDYIAHHLVQIAGDRGDSAETREAFSPIQWWHTLRNVPQAWRATAAYRAGPLHRISATTLVAKYRSIAVRSFCKLVVDRTRVVTFCDAAPHDNLLTQIAQAHGALTITAQHGQYRLLDKTNMSTDAEAYANFVSDRLLCWGEATCADFVRYGVDRRRMTIVGWIRTWEKIEPREAATGTFGVMLNGENGAESNIELLRAAERIADELALRYVVRLHPSYAPPSYRSLVNERCASIRVMPTAEYVEAVDFSIAHMSGATIEMLHVESPVYALDDGRLAEAFKIPGLSFDGVEEMLATIVADAETRDRGRSRTRQLGRWFNDDTNQDSRILNAMLAEES